MTRYLTLLCAFTALMLTLGSCRTSQHNASRDLHPDEVFTMTQSDIEREIMQVNALLSGEWKYSGPSVAVSGRNLLAGVAKPIAKGKLKKKLKNAYKQIGIDRARPEFIFNRDGSCKMSIMGLSVNGTYNYNPDLQKITFKWHGIPMSANLKIDNKKKIHLTFDADKLLTLISTMGRFSNSSAVKELSKLLDNYEDVMVGFELKR